MRRWLLGVVLVLFILRLSVQAQEVWQGYAKDAQHNALSSERSQPLGAIVWQTPVDLQPVFHGDDLLIHYGSPLITAANTIIVPVKTGSTGGFRIEAHRGSDGALLWVQNSDYALPSHNWTPSYGPTLTPQGRVYYAGASGTIYYRTNIDSAGKATVGQANFYATKKKKKKGKGKAKTKANANANVKICTPLTSDASGTIYFGYRVDGAGPATLGNAGIARVNAQGAAIYLPLTNDANGVPLVVTMNCAPTLSNDGALVYFSAHEQSATNGRASYLFAVESQTLEVESMASLTDPQSDQPAGLSDNGSASPTVGPDGNVYYGVLDSPLTTRKGWLLQFDRDLSQSTGAPGAFGWDDTASVVPSTMVTSYHGSSSYLLMTKYNNYASSGGDGKNRLAILDPNDSQTDSRTGATVMKEVLTILGPTPDDEYDQQFPGAVREWCINSAVVDPATNSVLANSEDGKLYRWDLTGNTFTEMVTLTPGVGEAYTPTLIGADGKVYAINDATLFAIGVGQ